MRSPRCGSYTACIALLLMRSPRCGCGSYTACIALHCAGKDGDLPVSVSATMPYVCDDVDDHEYDVRYRRRSLSRLGIGRSSLSAAFNYMVL
jgi:hypothetical protein